MSPQIIGITRTFCGRQRSATGPPSDTKARVAAGLPHGMAAMWREKPSARSMADVCVKTPTAANAGWVHDRFTGVLFGAMSVWIRRLVNPTTTLCLCCPRAIATIPRLSITVSRYSSIVCDVVDALYIIYQPFRVYSFCRFHRRKMEQIQFSKLQHVIFYHPRMRRDNDKNNTLVRSLAGAHGNKPGV